MTESERLKKRIKNLEKRIETAEVILGKRDFSEVFMTRIHIEFQSYIKRMCSDEARFQGDPMLDRDDLQQEVMEYIFKYNLKAAQWKWDSGEEWYPYIKRSVANCFCNIRKSRKNWHKRLNLRPDDLLAYVDVIDEQHNILNEASEDIDFADYCSEVLAMLDEEEQMVFNEMLSPSPSFSDYIRKNTSAGAEARASKKMISDYFHISYTRVLAIFKKFRGCVDYCLVAA
jgi:hypothetical protein